MQRKELYTWILIAVVALAAIDDAWAGAFSGDGGEDRIGCRLAAGSPGRCRGQRLDPMLLVARRLERLRLADRLEAHGVAGGELAHFP